MIVTFVGQGLNDFTPLLIVNGTLIGELKIAVWL